jgi:hypothetical protein
LERSGVRSDVTLGATITSTLLVALFGGPERRHWQLTCPCRIVHFGAVRKLVEQI